MDPNTNLKKKEKTIWMTQDVKQSVLNWLLMGSDATNTMGSTGWVKGQTITNTGKFYRYIY